MRFLRFLLLAGVPAVVSGQAVVEYGLGAGAAGNGTAAAARGIAGALNNLGKAVGSATGQAASSSSTTSTTSVSTTSTQQPAKTTAAKATASKPAAAEPQKPAVVYEDPAGITEDMDQAEMIRRFGEPAMKITSANGESLTYSSKEKTYEVELRDGKVYSVHSKNKPKQAALVILQ